MVSLGLRLLILAAALGSLRAQTPPPAVSLKPISHTVLYDERTYQRLAGDRQISVWTDDPATAFQLLEPFSIPYNFEVAKGQIVAVFFNDQIKENLTQIVLNKNTNQIFADYADSGMEFKLRVPEAGHKYSHVTVVIFTPPHTPSHLGMRRMVQDGLSEKRP